MPRRYHQGEDQVAAERPETEVPDQAFVDGLLTGIYSGRLTQANESFHLRESHLFKFYGEFEVWAGIRKRLKALVKPARWR